MRPIETNDQDSAGQKCEIMNIWEILGRRWALAILKNLSSKEVIRFNELKKLLSGIRQHCFGSKAVGVRT